MKFFKQHWFWLIVLVGIALRFWFHWISLTHLPATSDEASSVLWAKHIATGHWPLLFIGQPYQFPVESYLMAPLIDWMPRNAFGARYQAFTFGWLSLGLLLLIVKNHLTADTRWLPAMLLLVPSAYWLQHTSGYTPPQYASTLFFTALMLFLVSLAVKKQNNLVIIFIACAVGGLATSNHLVALPVLAATIATLLFVKSNSGLLVRCICIAIAALIGLAPFIWVKVFQPEAYEVVSNTVDLPTVWKRLTSYIFAQTLPGVFGINPTLFTDLELNVGWGNSLRALFSGFYLTVIVCTVAYRFADIVRQVSRQRSFSAQYVDIFLLTSLATLVAYCTSAKGGNDQYRFMLPIVCCFPFLVSYVLERLSSLVIKRTIQGVAVAYVGLNIAYTLSMTHLWADKDEGVFKFAYTYDLQPVIDYLRSNKVTHCYASFWIAYRITYETDEEIKCAQPYNERFHGWPLLYKEEVDAQENTPAIMMESDRSELSAYRYMQHLYTSFVYSDEVQLGPYWVFENFKHKKYKNNQRLQVPSEKYSVWLSNDKNKVPILALSDLDPHTRWVSDKEQKKGMSLTVQMDETYPIELIDLTYRNANPSRPNAIALYAYLGEEQVFETGDYFRKWMSISYERGKPVYGPTRQRIRFNETIQADRIEVEIYAPNADYKWELDEVTLSGSVLDKIN